MRCDLTSLRLIGATALVVLSSAGCQKSPPLEETPYKVLAHKMELEVGAAALGNFDTEVRLDSRNVNVGTFLNAEDELGLGKSATVGQANLLYRFNRRHHLELSYMSIDRDGKTTLTEEIDFAGVTIPAVAVTTTFETTSLAAFYTYNFAVQERWEVGGQFGLTWSDINLKIAVDDDPLQAEADIGAPIPQFGLTGYYAVTPKLRVGGAYQWLQILWGDYQGAVTTTKITLDYDILRNVGVGLGLVSYKTDADLTFSDVTGTLNYGYQGALLYLRGML